jgi:predicted ATP-grasp superfamily ATP-dependent carboligase
MMCMAPPHILVHEYVTGGGWPGAELPTGLASEAFAMLQAILTDLDAWGGVRTTTTLDSRLGGDTLPATRTVPLQPAAHLETLTRLAGGCDAALIIAPETDGILARLTELVEATGVPVLGSSSAAVTVAADKWQCYHLFRQNGIPTPDTWHAPAGDAVALAQVIGLPLVVKPRDGCGSEGVCLATDSLSLESALGQASREVLLQRFIQGVHASASLLVQDGAVLPISLNGQRVTPGHPFVYHGGWAPLEHPLKAQALALSRRAVTLLPGLRGYVGVDLVLADSTSYVIEINPRLTTSYVGLRQVADCNLARAIWDCCRSGRLPERVGLRGHVTFCRDGNSG